MSVLEPNPSPSSGDLETQLRAFYLRQLPQPWPTPQLVLSAMSTPRRPANNSNLMRSRWALAASVALLLFGSWLLPGRLSPVGNAEHGANGPLISNIPPDMPKAHKRQKQVENKNKVGLAADEGDPIPELEESELPMLR